jgi:hypothetical protein
MSAPLPPNAPLSPHWAFTGQCFNYTIAPLSNNVQQTSFSSQNTADSTANQINVSASVSLAFDFFKAKDDFSFSELCLAYRSSASNRAV